MKKLIFLIIAASLTGSFLSAQTNDSKARTQYFAAAEDFDMGDYKGALLKIADIERILGGTNARLSYLATKAQYKLSDIDAAQAACKKYFASNPKKDPGYYEMVRISEEIEAAARTRTAENALRREAEAERVRMEEEKSVALAEQMQFAADRRVKDAKEQEVRDKKEAADFKRVQSENTKAAYQDFMYQYPYGKLLTQARNEMQKKWPAPVRVLRKNKYGYIDKDGKMVISASYDYASEFSEGVARVGKKGKYGFIDEKGKIVAPIKYVATSNFNYGLAVVKAADNKFFFIKKNGEPFNENVYLDAKSFSEGLAAVQDQFYKYGFINTKGELVINNEYSVVSWFKEGFAAVGKLEGGKTLYTYINTAGEKLTDFEFEDAKDFKDGVGRVRKNGKYALIDKFGSLLTSYEFEYISEFNEEDGMALAKKNGMDIYLNKDGRTFVKVNNKMVRTNM